MIATLFIYIGLFFSTVYANQYIKPIYQLDFNLGGITLYEVNTINNLILIFLLFYSYFVYQNLLQNDLIAKKDIFEIEVAKRKQNEKKTQKLLDDLSISYQHLEQFSYVISHNMHGPLAQIKGFLTLYNKAANDTDENTKLISYVEKAANHLDIILADLNFILI